MSQSLANVLIAILMHTKIVNGKTGAVYFAVSFHVVPNPATSGATNGTPVFGRWAARLPYAPSSGRVVYYPQKALEKIKTCSFEQTTIVT